MFLPNLDNLIKSRQETIVKNLKEADNKFREAQEILSLALKNLTAADAKAQQIKAGSNAVATQTAINLLNAIEDDIKRLEKGNGSTIRFKEQKLLNKVF